MGVVLKKPSSSNSVLTSTPSTTSPTLRQSINSFLSLDYDFCRRTYWLCSECGNPRTGYSWCQACESNRFESEFPHWTSGNIDIDDFIRQSQKNAYTAQDYLEWIPYERFVEVKYLANGGYGDVYTAYWKEGPRWAWNEQKMERVRTGPRKVVLKSLTNSQEITLDFLNELALHHICNSNGHVIFCYGVSQDPTTKNYLLVMDYAKSFYKHVIKPSQHISWKKKLEILYDLIIALASLHSKNIVHRNFHPGNIFLDTKHPGFTCISDIGQYFPPNKSYDNNGIYGVLPYVSPEILLGSDYSTASDIYCFGMIMWSISTGRRPFDDRPHDQTLALDICNNLRPKAVKGTPPSFVKLMKRCWDSNPEKRPDSTVVADILEDWLDQLMNENGNESTIRKEFSLAEEQRKKGNGYVSSSTVHPMSIYTSRLLDFPNLNVKLNKS
ncbi:7114_t:CDS:2 [Cetraspora pellucida]|uniref:7114_t:CDS:1 n=1 Tax=Cetraspora pellucida TaxID=1433469 RepID=A0A9N9HK94_9GLOM|nr:7114_t:CDS:2 [Cetraspora pellucida]